jgi:2-haloacid dehalogenase
MSRSALIFDAYGTLFDVASVAEACADLTQDPTGLVALWRAKQLEYSFVRTLMGPAAYVDFWQIMADALDFAVERLGLSFSRADSTEALRGWLSVQPYPEVEYTFELLARDGRHCLILSNGTPTMLQAALTNAGVAHQFEAVLSVDTVRVFKPHPRVYQMAVDAVAAPTNQLLFVSSNGWDAAGALAFGLPVAWINRSGAPTERLGRSPELTLPDLAALPSLVA